MAAAGDDAEASVQADLAFHRRLMTATHNNFLMRMERVIAIGLAERDKLVHGASAAEDPVPSHRKVLDAIVAGDPDGGGAGDARPRHEVPRRPGEGAAEGLRQLRGGNSSIK